LVDTVLAGAAGNTRVAAPPDWILSTNQTTGVTREKCLARRITQKNRKPRENKTPEASGLINNICHSFYALCVSFTQGAFFYFPFNLIQDINIFCLINLAKIYKKIIDIPFHYIIMTIK
jgi:hypothetical protein